MLFASRPHGFFVDFSENGTLLARTDAKAGALVVDHLGEAAAGDEAALTALLDPLLPKKGSRFLHAVCGIYPARRLVRRMTLEPKRLREPRT